jgi:hypothetical protein
MYYPRAIRPDPHIPFDKPPAPLPFYRTDLHKYAFINAPEMIINDRCKMV